MTCGGGDGGRATASGGRPWERRKSAVGWEHHGPSCPASSLPSPPSCGPLGSISSPAERARSVRRGRGGASSLQLRGEWVCGPGPHLETELGPPRPEYPVPGHPDEPRCLLSLDGSALSCWLPAETAHRGLPCDRGGASLQGHARGLRQGAYPGTGTGVPCRSLSFSWNILVFSFFLGCRGASLTPDAGTSSSVFSGLFVCGLSGHDGPYIPLSRRECRISEAQR